ncbi:hypothetical protein [uncultured Ruminococcus sp.]|uniref:hypothetical protein n=1 Tax=uncultured Ruminococcus sp. TaxID=165186 RepID=UPI0025DD4ABC|nr:hypothetical protein [uncultured Ruminococcus sp.]
MTNIERIKKMGIEQMTDFILAQWILMFVIIASIGMMTVKVTLHLVWRMRRLLQSGLRRNIKNDK